MKKVLGVVFLLCCLPGFLWAAPGDLDLSFGTGGFTTTPTGPVGDYAKDIVIQPDGKSVVAGYGINASGNNDFLLVRYNPDGSLDSGFGEGGSVITPVGNSDDYAYSLLLLADGRFIAAGHSKNLSNDFDFTLVSYNADGSLDTSFGAGGIVSTPVGNSDDYASVLVQQSDGKLLVGGYSRNNIDTDYDFTLVRYNLDGSLDLGFGSGGKVRTEIGTYHAIIYSLVQQPDGKIVAVGTSSTTNYADFTLARYNLDGSLDSSFGAGGIVVTDISTLNDTPTSLLIQKDGKLIAGGLSSGNSKTSFTLARYNPDGSLDPSYGIGGFSVTSIGNTQDVIYDLVQQVDEKLVAAGLTLVGSVNYDVALARYNNDGSLDVNFGTAGIVTTALGNDNDTAYALAQQTDGKLVAAGYSKTISNQYNVALARYNAGLIGTVAINGGDTATSDPNVTLDLTCLNDGNGCTEMQFSDDGLVWSGWEAFATTRAYTLLPGTLGTNTVYVQFRDAGGVVSDTYSDTIEIQGQCPDLLNVTAATNQSNGNTVVSWDAPAATDADFCIDVLTPEGDFHSSLCLAPTCHDEYICTDYYDSWGWYLYTDCQWTPVCNTLETSQELTAPITHQFFASYTSDTCADNTPVKAQQPKPAFGVPKFLALDADRNGNLYVAWDKSRTPGVDYELEMKQGAGGFLPVTIVPDRWFRFLNLPTDTYTLRVRALKPGMTESPWRESAPVDIEWTCAGPAKFYYPTATVINRRINLNWEPSRTAGVDYTLEMSVDGGPFSEVQSGPAMSYSASGLADGSYVFRLKTGGMTDYTDSGWISTPPIELIWSCYGVPKIAVSDSNPYGNIQVSWKASRTRNVEYVLEMSQDGGAFAEVYRGTSNGHRVKGLSNGDYQFRVMVTRADRQDSAWGLSDSANVTLAARPARRVYAPGRAWDGTVKLSWLASRTLSVDNYLVEASVDGGAFSSVGSSSSTSLTLTNLPEGATIFRVIAQAPDYVDSKARVSDETDVRYRCYGPLRFTVPDSHGNGRAYLTWRESRTTGATYEVEASYQGGAFTQVATPTETGVLLKGLTAGDYVFRVRAVKAGLPVMAPSNWKTSGPCTITTP